MIIVHGLSLFIIVFFIMGFNIPFSILGQKNEQAHAHLRIMTCNIGENVDVGSLRELISRTRPDIIALQEAYDHKQNTLKEILPQDQWDLTFQEHLGLASRLKIRNADVKNKKIWGGRGGLVGKYELEGPMGRMYFFNVHLETPRKGLEAVAYNGLNGLSEMRRVAELQAKESTIVSPWIASYRTVLIAGDFNMSEMNPIYKKYWSLFTNAFSKAGFGFGYTRYSGWHGVRIDHLLCDGDWKVIRCQVGPDIGSDHRPMVADVEFVGKSSVQPRQEGQQEQTAPDSAALISEDFEISLGKFEDYGMADITIDTEITYLHGNALKIEHKTGSDCASTGIRLDLWCLEDYPIISFAYMIPEGVSLGMRVKTILNDWICLGGTAMVRCLDTRVKNEFRLIDDGEWHEMHIDAGPAVKSLLPRLKYLTEFQFYIPAKRYQKDTFWIDDVKIHRKG